MAETRISKPKTGAKTPVKRKTSKHRVACAEDPPESPRAAAKRLGRLLDRCEEAFDLLMFDAWETEGTDDFRASLLAAARVAKAAASLGLAINRLSGESRHRIVFERAGADAAPAPSPILTPAPATAPATGPAPEDRPQPAAVLLPPVRGEALPEPAPANPPFRYQPPAQSGPQNR